MAISSAIRVFIDTHPEYSVKTLSNYQYQLTEFVRRTGDISLYEVDENVVRRYFYGAYAGDPNGLKARVQPSTFNYVRTLLGSFFGWCVRRGGMIHNPMDRHTVPKEPPGKAPAIFLSPAQLMAALNTTDHPRDRIMLAVLMNTAVRESELTRIRVADVDLARGVIQVRVSKGNKRDEMPITADLDTELRRWLLWYTQDVGDIHARKGCVEVNGRGCGQATRGLPLCGGWFLVPKRNPAFYQGGERQHGASLPTERCCRPADTVRRALEKIGVRRRDADGRVVAGKGTGCHTFRRSAADALFEHATRTEGSADKALMVTQSFLHHSSAKTTETYLNREGFARQRNGLLAGQSFLSIPEQRTVVDLPVPGAG